MATPNLRNNPLVLIIRDGWGMNPNPEHDAFNAVKIARTPTSNRLMADYPWTLVKTSGEDVGLPDGTMGNSEVGHQNIGAGRIVDQESVAITKACRAGLHDNAVIAEGIRKAKSSGHTVHLMGIASDAGVHGLLAHLYACVRACRHFGHDKVVLHLFTDGRDTGPFTGKGFVEAIERELASIGIGRIASLCGRYWAMDRDFRWERVERAFGCLTGYRFEPEFDNPKDAMRWADMRPFPMPRDDEAFERELASLSSGPVFKTAEEALAHHYENPAAENLQGDEFVPPCIVADSGEDVLATRIRSGDTVIFYNYRGDRPREISAAFVYPDASWADVKPSPDSGRNGFDRGPKLDLHYITMTAYSEDLAPFVHVAFPKPPRMQDIAGAYLSRLNLSQFRCAETEKFPHVTFFFNDYRDEPYLGETREIIQSPKVATYDLQPEMSAEGITQAVLRRLAAPDCEALLVVNFANGDMVGHTGKLAAAVSACETVDACVGRIVDATLARGGSLIVTADHGNAEQMFDPETNAPHTAHTTYDVPLIVVGKAFTGRSLRGDTDASGWFRPETREARGRLADILPTAFDMLGLPIPDAMTGRSLLSS